MSVIDMGYFKELMDNDKIGEANSYFLDGIQTLLKEVKTYNDISKTLSDLMETMRQCIYNYFELREWFNELYELYDYWEGQLPELKEIYENANVSYAEAEKLMRSYGKDSSQCQK